MTGLHRYDGDLPMFVVTPRELDAGRLRFLRWLAEQRRLEHEVAGPATGPLAGLAWGPSEARPAQAA